jgi:hypothetical protein
MKELTRILSSSAVALSLGLGPSALAEPGAEGKSGAVEVVPVNNGTGAPKTKSTPSKKQKKKVVVKYDTGTKTGELKVGNIPYQITPLKLDGQEMPVAVYTCTPHNLCHGKKQYFRLDNGEGIHCEQLPERLRPDCNYQPKSTELVGKTLEYIKSAITPKKIKPKCDAKHRELCQDKESCERAGGHFYDAGGTGRETCNDVPQLVCDKEHLWRCNDKESCQEAGGQWLESTLNFHYCARKRPEKGEPKAEEPKKWKVGGLYELLTDTDAAIHMVGVEGEYDLSDVAKGLVVGARAGYLHNGSDYAERDSDITSERRLLPDGTTYKDTSEQITTTTTKSHSQAFVGVSAGMRLFSWLKASLGLDARLGEKETTKAYERTLQLERNNQPLGSPKTLSTQESSSETSFGLYPYTGAEACRGVSLWGLNAEGCAGVEAGYDTKAGKFNLGGKLGAGVLF